MSFGNRLVLVLACSVLLATCGCSSPSQKTNDQARESSQHASAQERELISAALQGNAKRVEAALKAGADVNAFDETLGTPLGGASYSGSLETVRLLSDRGANVNAKDSKGMTPLMNATLSGNSDVVRFLIAKGADVNIGSPSEVDGRKFTSTALLLARGSRHNEIVTLLIQAGAKE
jgi:ankyrin repeat protein